MPDPLSKNLNADISPFKFQFLSSRDTHDQENDVDVGPMSQVLGRVGLHHPQLVLKDPVFSRGEK